MSGGDPTKWNETGETWATHTTGDTRHQLDLKKAPQKKDGEKEAEDSTGIGGIIAGLFKAFGDAFSAVVGFFTVTIPEKWNQAASAVSNAAHDVRRFVSDESPDHLGLVQKAEGAWNRVSSHFTGQKLDPKLIDAIRHAVAETESDPQQIERDTLTLAGIAYRESRGNRFAVNETSHAKGIFQFLDGTAKENGVTNPFDVADSCRGAARYLHSIRSTIARNVYGGDESKVTSADEALGWGFGAGGADHLLNARGSGEQAVTALAEAGTHGNVAQALGGNLTSQEKAANPNWRNMAATTLATEMASRFDDVRKGVYAANAGQFHLSPQDMNPLSRPSTPEMELAQNRSPQNPPHGPSAYRRVLSSMGIAPETEARAETAVSSAVTSLRAGVSSLVHGFDNP